MAKKQGGNGSGMGDMMQMLRQLFAADDRLTLDEWAERVSQVPVNPRLDWWAGIAELPDMPLPFPGETPVLLVLVDLQSDAPQPLYLNILMEGGVEEAYGTVLEFMAEPEEGQPQAPARLFTPDAQSAFALGNLLRQSKIKVQQGGPPQLTEFLEFTKAQIMQQASQEMQVRQPLPFLQGVPDEQITAFVGAFQEFIQRRTWEIMTPDKPLYAVWTDEQGKSTHTYATGMGDMGQSYGLAFYSGWLDYVLHIMNARPDLFDEEPDLTEVLAFTGGLEAVSWGDEQEFHPDDWATLKRLKLVQRGKAPALLRLSHEGTLPTRTPLPLITGILNVLNERAAKRRTRATSLKGEWGGVQVQFPGQPQHELTEVERQGSVGFSAHLNAPAIEARTQVQAPATMLYSKLLSEVRKQSGGKQTFGVMPDILWLPLPEERETITAQQAGTLHMERQKLLLWNSSQSMPLTLAHLARLGVLESSFRMVQVALNPQPVNDLSVGVEVLRETSAEELRQQREGTQGTSSSPPTALKPSSTPKFGDGMCRACGFVGNKASMTKHQAKCEGRPSGQTDVYRLRVTADGPYFLDLEVKADATLDDVDSFLRGIWLDCCGHMSEFSIGPQLDYDAPVLRMQKPRQPPLSKLLSAGQKFRYTYDMGTSTDLELNVQARENVSEFRGAVRLLARNFAPEFECAHPGCKQTAKWANSWEYDQRGFPLMHCTKHMDKEAKADGAYLPIVNSPRMGQCAYEGGNDDNWPPGTVPLPG